MTLLTAVGALGVLACLLPLAAWLFGRRRSTAVAAVLGLRPPTTLQAARTVLVVVAIALLGLAAAQPALTHTAHARERAGVQALFVLDTSRSMAASATPTSATRLDRAVAAAATLRASIPDVPSGVATLTDRVLPDLLPVADRESFDSTVRRSVGIEQPPPSATSVRATTYTALDELSAGNYFAPGAKRRVVVLLTDGESGPVDAGEIASALPPGRGYRFLAIRFWNAGESVFRPTGRPEAAYRPDPAGRVVLADLARALGGRAYEEADVSAAASALRGAAGSGPTTPAAAVTTSRTALAPWLAALALLLLLGAIVPWSQVGRRLHWNAREEGEASAARGRARRRAGSGSAARLGGNAQQQP